MYEYSAKVLKCTDGDTLKLLWDLGHSTFVIEKCRLLGVNTPESFGVKKGSDEYKAGKKAQAWLIQQLKPEWGSTNCALCASMNGTFKLDDLPEVRIETHKLSDDKFLAMQREKKGKYGRYLITLYVGDDTESINTKLIHMGFGAEY